MRTMRTFCFVLAALALTAGTGCGPSDMGAEGVDASGGGVDGDVSPDANASWYTDDDGDGYSEAEGDCDDTDPNVHPGAVEICGDGIDNNCNGATDVNEPDADGDGWGPCQGDCDDTDPAINPGAAELPDDGIDNDCDGIVDADFDGDGYTVADGDCDDHDPKVHPGAKEHCWDGVDNDCNGYIDQAEPDMDGDGFGPCSGDCDDSNDAVYPGAPEVPGDGVDNNCDYLVDADVDGDGWTVANGDCDDDDPNVNPSVPEDCNDGIDNNCNGTIDTDCITPCQLADLLGSNVGCQYYAVDMDNEAGAAGACFAVIVSNTDPTQTANVTVERWVNNQPQLLNFPGHGTSRAIAPNGLQVFRIAGNCSAPGAPITGDAGLDGTGLARGAFRIRADLPVAAYQINPYEAANIHTTDASLLLASGSLDQDYYVVGYPQTNPARGSWDLRSAINVIGTVDGTTVTITSSTTTRAGGGVPALSPGQVWSTTLNEGDNLQIETQTTDHDLTGTRIQASAPVAVFSGNECADIPKGRGYCDHLEEQLTPLSTWGTEYAGAKHPQRASEKIIWRLTAAKDATTVTFDPPFQGNLVLNAGQVAEFATTQDFIARSTDPSKPIFLVQFMQGAEQTALESGTTITALGNLRGDPAMTISVPTAQYLERYGFLSDATYAYNWLVVVRTNPNHQIRLDCLNPIPNDRFTTIGAGPYQVARIKLSAQAGGVDGTCTAGARTIEGDGPFGIWVYGVFADTSYGYPGGMNLARIFNVD